VDREGWPVINCALVEPIEQEEVLLAEAKGERFDVKSRKR